MLATIIVLPLVLLSMATGTMLAAPKDGAEIKQLWKQCEAQEINTIIDGCAGLIERKPKDKTQFARAYYFRGNALYKKGANKDAIADFGR